ncbi:MAG: dihydrofolate reductase, partial [Oscillospiraceae bacterium]|nr:dihydrofolate reductase [Oscillospiraceae bacterium]
MINIIAAVAKNRVIGNDGHIPWHIPEDMAYFKNLTTGNIIIMGRKTYEEIGKPLSNRFHIIIS